jgi:signal transduction histidine kinase
MAETTACQDYTVSIDERLSPAEKDAVLDCLTRILARAQGDSIAACFEPEFGQASKSVLTKKGFPSIKLTGLLDAAVAGPVSGNVVPKGRYRFDSNAYGRRLSIFMNVRPGSPTPDHVHVELLATELLCRMHRIAVEAALDTITVDIEKARHVLREAVEYRDTAEEVSATGSFRWNPLSGADSWSPRTYALLEYDPSIAPGYDRMLARIHPDDRDKWLRHAALVTSEKRDLGIDYRLLLPDGSIRYLESFAVPDGPDEYVGAVVDVTDLRIMEDALHRAHLDLAKVSKRATMGELAASIAHELNQPLTSIVANAGASLRWMNRQPADHERARIGLEAVVRDGKRAGGIIHSLNALAMGDTQEFAPGHLGDVIQSVVAVFRPELARHSISLRVQVDDDLPKVIGRPDQLEQVIFNLVMNAVEAMASKIDRQKVLTASCSASTASNLTVRITDTAGDLLPMDAIQIFEPFYSTKANGMGMGLSICRTIVEAHGGHIQAHSNLPGVTTFEFSIPAACEATLIKAGVNRAR